MICLALRKGLFIFAIVNYYLKFGLTRRPKWGFTSIARKSLHEKLILRVKSSRFRKPINFVLIEIGQVGQKYDYILSERSRKFIVELSIITDVFLHFSTNTLSLRDALRGGHETI